MNIISRLVFIWSNLVKNLKPGPMRAIFLLLLSIFYVSHLSSQSLTHRAITSSGKISESTNIKISYTIGEAVVDDFGTVNTIFTTGVQQGVNAAVGYDDINQEISLNIYPNPVKDLLNLSFDEQISGKVRIEIYSVRGELFQSREFYPDAGGTTESVDVAQLPAGIFILRIGLIDKGKTKSFTLVKGN